MANMVDAIPEMDFLTAMGQVVVLNCQDKVSSPILVISKIRVVVRDG